MRTLIKVTTTQLAKKQWPTFTMMTSSSSRLSDGSRSICTTENSPRSPYSRSSRSGRLSAFGGRMSAPKKSLPVGKRYKKICSLLIPYVFLNHVFKKILEGKKVWLGHRHGCTNTWRRLFHLGKSTQHPCPITSSNPVILVPAPWLGAASKS